MEVLREIRLEFYAKQDSCAQEPRLEMEVREKEYSIWKFDVTHNFTTKNSWSIKSVIILNYQK